MRRVALNLATSGLRRARQQLAALARMRTATAGPAHTTDRLAIEAGLRRLSHRQRQVLVLHYGADLPVEEIARQLRVPTGVGKSELSVVGGPVTKQAVRLRIVPRGASAGPRTV